MVRIWGRPNSLNVQKVMWAIAELGLAHERYDVGGPFGGLGEEEFRHRNPNQLIPVIEDEGAVVWESNAIVRYLSARWGVGTLWDADPGLRAQADQWMDWQQTTVQASLGPLFLGLIRTPPEERDNAALSTHAKKLGQVFGILEERLSDRRFVAGDWLTMGDIPVGAAFNRFMQLPIERPALANLERWYASLTATATFRHHVMIPLT